MYICACYPQQQQQKQQMEEMEDLEAFTNVLRSRFYNSGYREGLFKGKSEVIQEGFDRGYQVGALFAVLKVLEGAFLNSELREELEELEEDGILKEIVSARVRDLRIPRNTMPHITQQNQNTAVDSSFNMDKLLDKAAHLQREQELFLRELEAFKARLERVEIKIFSKKVTRK